MGYLVQPPLESFVKPARGRGRAAELVVLIHVPLP